jgi:hypothetical protein
LLLGAANGQAVMRLLRIRPEDTIFANGLRAQFILLN